MPWLFCGRHACPRSVTPYWVRGGRGWTQRARCPWCGGAPDKRRPPTLTDLMRAWEEERQAASTQELVPVTDIADPPF